MPNQGEIVKTRKIGTVSIFRDKLANKGEIVIYQKNKHVPFGTCCLRRR
jgi:hypothetical protein